MLEEPITVSRRNFLIGSSAAVAALLVPKPLGAIAKAITQARYRKVYDVVLSSNACADGISEFSILRDNVHLFQIALNWRASFRWVSYPDGELIFDNDQALHVVVAPAFETARLCVHYKDRSGRAFAETYKWVNDVAVLADHAPLDVLNECATQS